MKVKITENSILQNHNTLYFQGLPPHKHAAEAQTALCVGGKRLPALPPGLVDGVQGAARGAGAPGPARAVLLFSLAYAPGLIWWGATACPTPLLGHAPHQDHIQVPPAGLPGLSRCCLGPLAAPVYLGLHPWCPPCLAPLLEEEILRPSSRLPFPHTCPCSRKPC